MKKKVYDRTTQNLDYGNVYFDEYCISIPTQYSSTDKLNFFFVFCSSFCLYFEKSCDYDANDKKSK